MAQEEKYRRREPEQSLTAIKVPPQALELEKAVLGAIMIEKDAFDVVARTLKSHMFYHDAHQWIFKAMEQLVAGNRPIDELTVSQQLITIGKFKEVGEGYGITSLTINVVSGANVATHSQVIFEKYLRRELIRLTGELHHLAYDETEDIFKLLDGSEKSIGEIGLKNIEAGMVKIDKVVKQALDKIQDWILNDDAITGIPSGFPDIDKATRGWQPGDFIVLGARPSVGKTAFALNIIKTAASNEKRSVAVAVWSLEMKAVYLALRMLAAESKKFLYHLQTGKLTTNEMDQLVQKTGGILSKLNIFFDDSNSITLQSLSRKARRLKKTDDLGLIVIDYLQLMSGDEKAGNREQEISKISRGLKNLAQELDIPIIALSQLSRDKAGANVSWDYGPPISAMRESGAIEQDADVIMMLWAPADEDIERDPDLAGKRKVRIAKQRNGMLITETLEFKNEIQLFEAIIPDHSLAGNWKPVNHHQDAGLYIQKGSGMNGEHYDKDAPF